MSYARSPSSLSACCSGCAAGASKCMGDDDVSAIGLASARASVAALRAQLNRFADPSAPAGYRLFSTKLAGSGPLDLSVGARVGSVLMKRMGEPGFPPDAKLAALAGQVMGDASGSVLTANLAYATDVVSGYADAHGLPSTSSTFFGVPIMYLLVAGAGAVILGMRKKGR